MNLYEVRTLRKSMMLFLVALSVLTFNLSFPIHLTAMTNEQVTTKEMEQILFAFLNPYIAKAVKQYYGLNRQFWKQQILEIENLGEGEYYAFRIKVKVETFVGPHGPPFGEEFITFEKRREKIKIIDFKHKDIN